MAVRPISTATVSFGLVSIPVKVFSTTEAEHKISFRQLHAGCGGRLRQQYVCEKDGQVVARADMAKGYEYAKDRYVVVSEEEIGSAEVVATRTIDIAEFVPVEAIDPVYFDKPYYLGPDKGGARPYALLAEAMRRAQLAGIAQYAARGKQYVVAVRATADGLVMQQLRYAHEVRSFSEIPMDEEQADVRDAELALALQLIELSTVAEFDPAKYTDTVYERLDALVQAKVRGEEVSICTCPPPQAEVIDLMAALKASVAASGPRPARKTAELARGGKMAEG